MRAVMGTYLQRYGFLIHHHTKMGVGLIYAEELVDRTQKLSNLQLTIGWTSVILGSVLAIAGSVYGSGNTNALLDHPGLFCTTAAIVFGGIGWHFIDRGTAATKVASISTDAILVASGSGINADKLAYEACVNAKVAWLEGRMNNERLLGIVSALKQRGSNSTPAPEAPAPAAPAPAAPTPAAPTKPGD